MSEFSPCVHYMTKPPHIVISIEGIEKILLKKWQQNSLKNISLNNAVRKLQL